MKADKHSFCFRPCPMKLWCLLPPDTTEAMCLTRVGEAPGTFMISGISRVMINYIEICNVIRIIFHASWLKPISVYERPG